MPGMDGMTLLARVKEQHPGTDVIIQGYIGTAMTQAIAEEIREGLKKQIPMGRLGTAEDVANAVRFLVSEHASYLTGQVIHVNGGMLMP